MAINTKLPVVRGTGGSPAYSDKVRQTIVNGLKLGWTRGAAFGRAGIHSATFYRWLEDDASFREAVDQAEAYAHSQYTTRLGRQAAAGSVKATTFFLERRYPRDWGPKLDLTITAKSLEDQIDEISEDELVELLKNIRQNRFAGA